ncbi:MAG TPA: LLM class flavin-dependent oxidoreductase [Acidimicrobiales bacterium]|nr:LLM class flavin-dependent oxidoreductase [Acidimicrobiales bacterium]
MFAVRYDMRCPEWSPVSPGELYATALEQATFVDRLELGSLVLSEHHGSPDGYLPSPLVLAAGMAAVTTTTHISIAAVLATLYDPVRLAEDIAVLDLVSGGRISLTLGLGYRREEYDMLGIPWEGRGRRLDECLDVLLRAWSGERFAWDGRTVEVRPLPLQKPHPLVFVGGSSPVAARRAARFGLSFLPTIGDPALTAAYEAECERLGTTPGFALEPSGPAMVYVAEDPDRAWEQVGPHLLHDAQVYESWQPPGQRTMVTAGPEAVVSVETLRAAGRYLVVTPEECAALIREHGSVVLHPLVGGMPADLSWPSLQLVVDRVRPLLTPAVEDATAAETTIE